MSPILKTFISTATLLVSVVIHSANSDIGLVTKDRNEEIHQCMILPFDYWQEVKTYISFDDLVRFGSTSTAMRAYVLNIFGPEGNETSILTIEELAANWYGYKLYRHLRGEKIKFEDSSFNLSGYDDFRPAEWMREIEVPTVKITSATSIGITVGKMIDAQPNVERIEIIGCYDLCDFDTQNCFENKTSLRECVLDFADIKYLASIASNDSLTSLTVNELACKAQPIYPTTVRWSCAPKDNKKNYNSQITLPKNVKTLSLSGRKIKSNVFDSLGELTQLSALKVVAQFCPFEPITVIDISSSVSKLAQTNIQNMVLDGCFHLDDDALSALINIKDRNINITKRKLSGRPIDWVVITIAQAERDKSTISIEVPKLNLSAVVAAYKAIRGQKKNVTITLKDDCSIFLRNNAEALSPFIIVSSRNNPNLQAIVDAFSGEELVVHITTDED